VDQWTAALVTFEQTDRVHAGGDCSPDVKLESNELPVSRGSEAVENALAVESEEVVGLVVIDEVDTELGQQRAGIVQSSRQRFDRPYVRETFSRNVG
jgi:hypothetical protein